MALRDPIAAYNAANNLEAHFVRDLLIDAGIEASVTEDVSAVGGWVGGLVPEIHKPQVWIDRADTDRAGPVLHAYEVQAAARRGAESAKTGTTHEMVEVTCEECGKRSTFPLTQRGSVQNCPHCGAYVDVGDDGDSDAWDEPPDE
ncbi:MAG: putative signal transducing protein [Deltaproteobacteria bacterium]